MVPIYVDGVLVGHTPIEKPIAKKEIKIARADLVEIARNMVKSGEFSMDDIFGQEELE